MKKCTYCGKEYSDEAVVCERDGMSLASDNLKPPAAPQAALTKAQETKLLQELVRIYQNCPERVATYTRFKMIVLVTAWLLIFFGFLLNRFEGVRSTLGCVFALMGGISLGLAIYFSNAVRQAPLFVRFTALREDEVQKRLKELA